MTKGKVKKQHDMSDAYGYNEGLLDFNLSYDLGQLDFDYDNKLRDKYPALKDAWDHYNNVKQLCESTEKENDEN